MIHLTQIRAISQVYFLIALPVALNRFCAAFDPHLSPSR
jgi:hypothetical protein